MTTKSALRTVEIFEYFAAERRPLSLKEISCGLSFPVSSAAALLKTLVHAGYLEYSKSSRSYLPTMRLPAFARWIYDELFYKTDIVGMMENLERATGEVVLLATRSDFEAQYVHVSRALCPFTDGPLAGTRRPLAQCGLGQMLLSTLSPREFDHIMRRINFGNPSPIHGAKLNELKRTTSKARHDGYLLSKGLYYDNISVLGLLLPRAPFDRVFALGVAGPSDRIEANLKSNLATLREAATVVKFQPPLSLDRDASFRRAS